MGRGIFQPGRNCWRIGRAHRFRAVQDAADYFRLIRRALLSAERTIFILGWDLTATIDLDPGAAASKEPTRFDRVLKYVVRHCPGLECYILAWDYSPVFLLERDPFSRARFSWAMPKGIRFAFDAHCPAGASHHQKVVVVDDQLAFCGGVDLTSHRWDTPARRADEPRRRTPAGTRYGPYHEVQAMMDGPVAADLGELARERWRATGVADLPAVAPSAATRWPADITPDLVNVDVAIARTSPRFDGRPPVRECEALFLDSIAAAKRTIYIENQYFTNTALTAALAGRLADPDGPDVVIVVPRDSHGWLEHRTIGALRDAAFQRLLAADSHRRLRIVAPIASRAREIATFVHSKVMIVDDDLLRIGSANCTHRSMGVDTECDVAVDARRDDAVRAGIRRVRDRLVAEHLNLPADEVTRAVERSGGLLAVLDRHRTAEHTLARVQLPIEPLDPPPDALRLAVDPDEPVDVDRGTRSLRRWWIAVTRGVGRWLSGRRRGAAFG